MSALGIVVTDMGAGRAFYARLGLTLQIDELTPTHAAYTWPHNGR
ncbi:hypothetical protein [Streptomyces piniterrae]|nr:hypothetical protein [Streptomyces piniterrae]